MSLGSVVHCLFVFGPDVGRGRPVRGGTRRLPDARRNGEICRLPAGAVGCHRPEHLGFTRRRLPLTCPDPAGPVGRPLRRVGQTGCEPACCSRTVITRRRTTDPLARKFHVSEAPDALTCAFTAHGRTARADWPRTGGTKHEAIPAHLPEADQQTSAAVPQIERERTVTAGNRAADSLGAGPAGARFVT